MRLEFSRKQRLAIWTRSGGHCESCKMKLKTGEGEYDHVIPYEFTRDTSVENGQLLCRVCHSEKTHKTDRQDIAKVHRIEAKHNGTWVRSKAKIPSRPFSKARAS